MKQETANTIGEVTSIVAEARLEWKLKPNEEIWFRGEDAKHLPSTLQPKLYRDLSTIKSLVPKKILRDEVDLHEEFERCGAQLYEHDDVDKWDWYFLMQHHGSPTRLLDWSDGGLMGVHFAVSGDLESTKGGLIYLLNPYHLLDVIDELPEIRSHAKAWAAYRRARRKKHKYWPSEWANVYIPGNHSLTSSRSARGHRIERPSLPNPPLVLDFPHLTRRVAAQRSRFMVYGRDKDWLVRWANETCSPIWRISIPASKIIDFRVQLRDAGVTESVIFPDLDGLGRELNQLLNTVKKLRSLPK